MGKTVETIMSQSLIISLPVGHNCLSQSLVMSKHGESQSLVMSKPGGHNN